MLHNYKGKFEMLEAVVNCCFIALGAFWVLAIGAEFWGALKTRRELKDFKDAD